jgi:HD domain
MGASSGVRSPAARLPSLARGLSGARRELDDPAGTALVLGVLILVTFALVRLTGGAPNALMELGYLPVALAAYAFGVRGGAAIGILVAASFGPVPALLGFHAVEEPGAWLIRATSFAGVGALVGRLLVRSAGTGDEVRARLRHLAERERETLLILARAAESREADAAEHVRRLELLCSRLALHAGRDAAAAAEIGWASMLHDIGKLKVPDRILLKPEPLDPDEWTIVRLHPIWSEQVMEGSKDLAVAREIARSHHENWDGTGYPDGLYGDRIPFAARVARIADAFDAMTNDRPYQASVSFEAALEELTANAGRDFDPVLARTFVELIRSDADLRARLTELRRS